MSALGFSNDVIGVFNSLPALALLLIGLPVGALADKLGYRVFILIAGFGSLAGAVVLSFAAERLVAVAAAGIYSLGLTVLTVLAVPMMAQLSTPRERVSLYSFNQSLSWVGGVLGYLLGGYIPELALHGRRAAAASASSLRLAFLAMAVLQAIALPLVIRLSTASGLRPTQALPARQLLQVDWGRFMRILIPQALLGIAAGMILNFIQLYLSQRFHLSPGPIGLILAAGALVTAAVALAAPAASRRLGMSLTISLSQLAGVPLVIGLAFFNSLPLALAALYLRQFILNLQAPLNQVFGMDFVEPQERARLASAQNVVFGIGFGGVGPLISGFLQVRGGFQLAFSVSALFYLLSGSTFLALFGRVRVPSETAG
jgi:MFS family permease